MESPTKYKCTNCQEEISIRIRCSVCTDYESCLQCFAAGAEIGKHESDHSYQFLGSGSIVPAVKSKTCWSTTEELHLLDAIEQYGFGNWEDIAKHIETRSPDEARDKYIDKYLEGPVGHVTWEAEADKRPVLQEHVAYDDGPLGPWYIKQMPPLDITLEEAAHLGYMTNRDDYEREYDPGAEKLISVLALQPEDEKEDLILKLAHIDIYDRRVRERALRKRLVRDYQLAANFFRGYLKRMRMSRDQREFRERLRTFSQFYTCHEFERLVNSLERERALRVRLSELNRYRYNGLQRMEDIVHFEQHVAETGRTTGPFGHGKTHSGYLGPNGERIPAVLRTVFTGQPRLRRDSKRVINTATRNVRNKKKRGSRLKFHRRKIHVPHRRPGLIRRIIANSKLLNK